MVFTDFLYILVLVLAVSLSGVSVAIIISYSKLISKYRQIYESKMDIDKKLQEGVEKELQETRIQLQKIVAEVASKAGMMVEDAKVSVEDQSGVLAKNLGDLKISFEGSFSNAAQQVQDEAIKMLQNMQKDIKIGVEGEFKNLEKGMAEQLAQTQKAFEQLLINAKAEVDQEMQVYKKEKEKQFDENVSLIVNQIVQKVLRKSLTQDEHSQLVMKALEDAKAKGIFE